MSAPTASPGPDTLRIPPDPGDPETVLAFTNDGTSLSFDVVLPAACADDGCRSQLAWATSSFALAPWEKVED